jgi:HEAT repeat protein
VSLAVGSVVGAQIPVEPAFPHLAGATETVLAPILVAEAAVLAVGVVVLFGHTFWWTWRSSRQRGPVRRAERELVAFVDRGGSEDLVAEALARLRPRERVRCLMGMAPNVRGESARRLRGLAGRLGLAGRIEARCRSRLWWRRLHAARLLSVVGGPEACLIELLHDRHPAVRAAAAEWTAAQPTPGALQALLPLLGDPTGLCRFTAQDSLLRVGARAAEPLGAYLRTARSEEAAAALEVAVGLADPRLMRAAIDFTDHPSPEARRQAARLLGALGGPGAVEALIELTVDRDGRVRAAAARALGVLERRNAAPRLAGMLRDAVWEVRVEAGLALRALGAPGRLYLRRSLGDPDPFAADMARQVMDLPASVGQVVSS